MLDKEHIQSRGFRNVIHDGQIIGFQFAFRSNYYRGVWLSQLRPSTVIVDGETFSGEQIAWTICGKFYEQAELAQYGDVHWALLEPAILTVRKPGGLTQGFHDLEVKYAYSCSYFPPAMDELMVSISSGPLIRRLLLV
ncbi:MAG: hypothetical protein IPJ46_19135 [Anaerolineales bacterium]|nr:hypothetical protein [Anaerolineales bacterium]